MNLVWGFDEELFQLIITLSPFTLLFHEAYHAECFVNDPLKYNEDMNTPDIEFDNVGERNAIKEETKAAEKHGDITNGEGRKSHKGQYITNVKLHEQFIDDTENK